MLKSVKKRLSRQYFSKTIAINKDLNDLNNVDLYKMLNESLSVDIIRVDIRNRINHVDENKILKPEYIKYIYYDNSDKQLFNTTKDNKLYMNITILIGHYTKIIDID